MAFALAPDGGLPRLFRFVDRGVLPAGILSHLDKAQNILRIDRDYWDRLSKTDQHIVSRTQRAIVSISEFTNLPVFRLQDAAE